MLWVRMSEDCTLLGKTVTEDGEGGTSTSFVEAAHFLAAFTTVSEAEAEQCGAAKPHTVCKVTSRFVVGYGDILRRADGRTYRVISVPEESPASFSFSQAMAEEWEVPSE